MFLWGWKVPYLGCGGHGSLARNTHSRPQRPCRGICTRLGGTNASVQVGCCPTAVQEVSRGESGRRDPGAVCIRSHTYM